MTERKMYLQIAYRDYGEQTEDIRSAYPPEQADNAAAECAYYAIHHRLPLWATAIERVIEVDNSAIFVASHEDAI